MGWKEYELGFEAKKINVVIICSIENMDPWGFTLEFDHGCPSDDFIRQRFKMRIMLF
jgi:hypothetical protein